MRGYIAAAILVVVWWSLAFLRPAAPERITTTEDIPEVAASQLWLSPLNRGEIHQALHGDSSLMLQLISTWDVDAQLLEAEGIAGVHRLSPEQLLRAHRLARQLQHGQTCPTPTLHLTDDGGRDIVFAQPPQRFLPQTYVGASMLMALVKPEQIVALPQGMRKQGHLYPQRVMDQIQLDTDRYNSEEIFRTRPDLAFVAHYSLPATIAALKSQNIQLFELNSIDTIASIEQSIERVGRVAGQPVKAALLALFMEASFQAIDNRIATQKHQRPKPSPRVLFLNWFTHYSTPTSTTLPGQLLARADATVLRPTYAESTGATSLWSIPVDQEQIVSLRPDIIILSSPAGDALKQDILSNAAFRDLPAVRTGNIFVVDDDAQQSPSQYLVLAYFDLYEMLMRAKP